MGIGNLKDVVTGKGPEDSPSPSTEDLSHHIGGLTLERGEESGDFSFLLVNFFDIGY